MGHTCAVQMPPPGSVAAPALGLDVGRGWHCCLHPLSPEMTRAVFLLQAEQRRLSGADSDEDTSKSALGKGSNVSTGTSGQSSMMLCTTFQKVELFLYLYCGFRVGLFFSPESR